jgi:hypothetical protein
MVWAGFVVTSGSAATAAGEAALMGHAYRHRIASERAMLTARFGGDYANLGYLVNRSRSAVYMTEPAGQATIRPCRADYGGRALTCAAPVT